MKWMWLPVMFILLLTGCATPARGTDPAPLPTPVGTGMLATEPVAEAVPPTAEPFTRDTLFLDSSELMAMPDQPGLVFLHIEGKLPTACHQFGSAICPSCSPNMPNLIQVNVFSLIETGKVCSSPATPFEQDIPLGVYMEGIYVVQVNGQYVGEFDAGTFGKEVEMTRGGVFLESISLVSPETSTTQPKLLMQGYLPTPCNVFKADVTGPNEQGEIQIDAYSLAPVGEACLDVIQDFTSDVPLGPLPTGTYSVWVNGENVGDLVVP